MIAPVMLERDRRTWRVLIAMAPPPEPRPALALWLFERDLSYRDAADALDTSHETVRRICLPFTDPERRVPQPPLQLRIETWTDGAITYASFFQQRIAA